MQQPYQPRVWFQPLPDAAGMRAINEAKERQASIQESSNAYYREEGITQEIVMEPLPLGGGLGYKWAFYKNGVRIPNGVWGI